VIAVLSGSKVGTLVVATDSGNSSDDNSSASVNLEFDSGVDPFDLERFVDAQDAGGSYARALEELRSYRKRSHWIWYVFPQFAGLGRSDMSQRYAIASMVEARTYLAHPILGERLIEAARLALAALDLRTVDEVFGNDGMKLRSSMTLFSRVAPDVAIFQRVLSYFDDGPDPATDELLSRERT
jgi:uncharacterized protein (DUF1810 family)